MSEPLLEVADLRKEFGGLTATDDASFSVSAGTITGLIGPNGAGKSTLFNLISGFYAADAGRISLHGSPITDASPAEIAAAGCVRTFQTPRPLEGMTVREAMMIGPQNQPGERLGNLLWRSGDVAAAERSNLRAVEQILAKFEIAHLIDQPATDLSGGQLKLVELARGMLTEPDILLLDEPVAGVNPTLRNALAGHLRRLHEDGTTLCIIEHDMEFIMELADPIVVLDQGHVLMEGPPEAVRSDERVIEAYLGGERT